MTDIITDLNQALQAQFGAGINLSPESFFGQLVGIMAERIELVWEAAQDVYFSQTPNTALGASLDNVGALRGIPRLQSTSSTVQNVRLFGAAGTLIPNTTQFSVVGSPLSIFQISSAVTLAAGRSCIQNVAFSAISVAGNWSLSINGSASASLPYNATALQVQNAIQALTFCSGCTVTGNMTSGFVITFNGAGTGGLMVQPLFGVTTDTLLDSGSNPVIITPSIVTSGIDQASVTLIAVNAGPVSANAGAVTVIVTPISGLSAVLNTEDAVAGTNVETDSAYRARMAAELASVGAATVPAIQEKLMTVEGVTSALVYENITDITDGHGRPPHSFECVVSGGSDSDVAYMIWNNKPAGIATYGTSSFIITDSQGQQHTIYFSRPSQVDLYLIVNLVVNGNYPSSGNSLVQQLLSTYINSLGQGVSVIVIPNLIAQLAAIAGIDGAVILIGTSPSPSSSNNIPIAAYQQAYTQTDFITVNTVPG